MAPKGANYNANQKCVAFSTLRWLGWAGIARAGRKLCSFVAENPFELIWVGPRRSIKYELDISEWEE